MVSHALSPEPTMRQLRLSDHDLRRSLVRFAQRRLPRGDAEDVVQDTLTDALAATRAPEDPAELRKWVFGIARRKVADHLAGMPSGHVAGREGDGAALPMGEVDAVDLVCWAKSEVESNPEDVRTLGWMVREGLFGEKLATIAAETGLPPARVRQRVSRLRRALRERWAAQVGAAAAVILLVVAWWSLASNHGAESAAPDDGVMVATPSERATALRDRAETSCNVGEWSVCAKHLDEAKTIDPDGERSERVVRLRDLLRSVAPKPAPAPSSMVPSPDLLQRNLAPKSPPVAPKPGGANTRPCECPEYDPMCGCLPGMGRSVVPPDP